MRNFKRKYIEDIQYDSNNHDERYNMAFRRVKRIKGFYIHFLVYVLVNSILLIGKYYRNSESEFWEWDTLNTVLFWGIGIIAHAASVFGKDLFFGKNWEERKIQELMDRDKEQGKKWE